MGCCMGVEGKDSVIEDKIKNGAVVVDARAAKAYAKDHYEGAISVPVGGPMAGKAADAAVTAASGLPADKSTAIVCHCAVGGEANAAAKALKRAGYTDVTNAGSLKRVKKLGSAKVVPSPASAS